MTTYMVGATGFEPATSCSRCGTGDLLAPRLAAFPYEKSIAGRNGEMDFRLRHSPMRSRSRGGMAKWTSDEYPALHVALALQLLGVPQRRKVPRRNHIFAPHSWRSPIVRTTHRIPGKVIRRQSTPAPAVEADAARDALEDLFRPGLTSHQARETPERSCWPSCRRSRFSSTSSRRAREAAGVDCRPHHLRFET